MELEATPDDEVFSSNDEMQELWPLGEVDPKRARFPCCIVWTPLPVVSWLAPYIGHVGIAREDGTVLDFAGSNLVSVDDLAYGSAARCLQLDKKKCCFPANLAAHVCARSHEHSEAGTAISWDDALRSGARRFEHKCYNLFTCNSHSFVADCLNRLAYGGSVGWNVLNLAALVWLRGRLLRRRPHGRLVVPPGHGRLLAAPARLVRARRLLLERPGGLTDTDPWATVTAWLSCPSCRRRRRRVRAGEGILLACFDRTGMSFFTVHNTTVH